MFERFALKEATNLSGGDPGGFFGGLLAGPRNVRCPLLCEGVFSRREFAGDRLFGKHVESRHPQRWPLSRASQTAS